MKTILTFAVSLFLAGQVFATSNRPVGLESSNSLTFSSESMAGPGKDAGTLIKAANKKGKFVFLVVFDKAGADKDKGMSIAKTASAKKKSLVEVIELNTTDTDNSGLVAKYGLAGAPLPLILVLDKNGTAAGGFVLGQATPDGLVNTIPSPKFSEIIKGLTEQKSVFIVTYKKSMIKKITAIANCNEAVKSMNDGAIIVELNIEDKEETTLLKNLNVNALATEPVIYAINKAGQVAGTFPSETAPKQLVLAANKVASSGCGPAGCAPGSSCAPAKK